MYVHMYVTIIDLQTLKIPSFFGVSGNGVVYTHFHPFPATFMEKMPSRRPHFFGQPHIGGLGAEIVGEAKTLRLKNGGNDPFIVELC